MSSGNPIIDAYWRHVDAGRKVVWYSLADREPMPDFVPFRCVVFEFESGDPAKDRFDFVDRREYYQLLHEAKDFLRKEVKIPPDQEPAWDSPD